MRFDYLFLLFVRRDKAVNPLNTVAPMFAGNLIGVENEGLEVVLKNFNDKRLQAAHLRRSAVERIYREVRVVAIGGGSEEILLDLAGRQLGYGK
jgi:Acyl-CoA dehydrogenase, C-terminal domain